MGEQGSESRAIFKTRKFCYLFPFIPLCVFIGGPRRFLFAHCE